MGYIPHQYVKRQLNLWSSTPLGRWAGVLRDDAVLTPGGRYVQRRTGLPTQLANLFAELNSIGQPR